MEIRQLKALVAVADTGSVTKASAILHIAQPAVTKQIRLLESELGVDLFERSRTGMRLNGSGRQVLDRARRALNELDRARAEVRSGPSDVHGLVTVGLLPSISVLLAPRLVDRVAERHPGIRLRLSVGYAGHLAQWLEAGDVDIATLFEQPMTSAFTLQALLLEDLWAVAPASAGLTDDDSVSLAETLAQPLVLPPAPHGLRSIIDSAAAQYGHTVTVPVETNDSLVQRRLVADGHGWTILPSVMAGFGPDAVSCAPICDPPLTRSIGTARSRHAESMTAGDAVAELLREVVIETVTSGGWPSARLL